MKEFSPRDLTEQKRYRGSLGLHQGSDEYYSPQVPDGSCGIKERILALVSEDLALRPGSASVVSVTLIELLNFSESQVSHL